MGAENDAVCSSAQVNTLRIECVSTRNDFCLDEYGVENQRFITGKASRRSDDWRTFGGQYSSRTVFEVIEPVRKTLAE